ncbi:TonB-dependent receptor plug domain-containing protein [Hyphomicrobium sp. xq]|uniref:TonB-dependent receptor plug domain-containing protein n=1 Tax=Hyphomicrobium album TaxID=2665159 RepID=A0A6I3KK63_9HYPH|nr:TonB-dependent receptor [Hyphomicrobium album]MTD94122.1 TonB-dependent receptor plug domain-containing protein [Hyphomicrobium album]
MSKFAYVALCGAAMSLAMSAPATAQDAAAMTSGGDVTADQATPLPPVVVEAPSQPIARRVAKKKATVSTAPAATEPAPAEGEATGAGETRGAGVYTLGQLDMIGGSTITNEAMYTFNRQSLGQAVNLLPGVTWLSTGAPSINSSGSRNEGDIFVRGFNRFQVPLYMDGVRVYLPADNRIDMNRFLTPDLAEVQVAKGYVSVLNGPGGEGGAINLVSRKPTKEYELEARVGGVFDGDLGSMGQWSMYGYTGTRQKGYYAQVSGTLVDQDHFDMSNSFTPAGPGTLGYANGIAQGFPYEDGGNRDRSDFRDWRINTKVGITPNASDEYSINYTKQAGEKNSPLHVNRQIVQGYFNPTFSAANNNGNNVRYWTWPAWDTSSLSFLSKTKLGDASYIKTNAYYNTFENTVSFFINPSYTNQPVDSPYEDSSVGGFIEMGTDLIPMNTLKGAIHFRKDTHDEHNINYTYAPPTATAVRFKRQAEEGWSFAVEDTFHATRYLDIVGGVSYDTNEVLEFKENGVDSPSAKPSIDAWNWQAAAIYHYSRDGRVHADVSSRTRFPTLFERYSTRFDAKTPDPNVPPERATNYEVGVSDTLFPGLHVSSAVFYSDIEDSIQNAFTAANGMASIVGIKPHGHYHGAEISADWDATRTLRVGGNYTYIDRDLDFAGAAASLPVGTDLATRNAVALTQMEGLPRNKAFFYLAWKATNQLTLTPSLEVASDRTALVTSCASTLVATGGNNPATISATNGNCAKSVVPGDLRPSYVNIGSYALLNFRADYDFTENFSTAVGVTNLLDQNYAFADGFPEAGRQFYATARAKF